MRAISRKSGSGIDVNRGLGEIGANAHLIDSHLPLVRAVARRYAGRGEELDDLVQVGAVGLMKASDRFDPNRGVAFATFATPAIEGEIRRHLRDRTHSVKIPRDLQRTGRNVRRHEAELAARLGRFPTTAELAAALKVDETEIERAVAADRASDQLAATPGDDALEPARVFEPLNGSDDRMLLAASLRTLNERERRIVFLRFHADMTERQIGRAVGISQAHVSRLLDSALAKLRVELAENESMNRHRDSGDITPNRVISPGLDSRISDVGAQQEAAPDRRSKGKQTSSYSGKFLVRMPSELHEQLAQAAQQEDVSLNRFVTDVLATSVGERPASEARPASAKLDLASDDPDLGPSANESPRLSSSAVRVALATNLVVVVAAGLVAVILLVLALQRGI
ncbi:MAG: sigma-70 family RNA polymerase sigma factor [Solirubrobacteraceae bacterium]